MIKVSKFYFCADNLKLVEAPGIYYLQLIFDFTDEPDDEVENDVQELVEKFRRNALILLELLDLSVPAVAKLSVSLKIN